jgi:hypothetical protein
MDWIARVPEFCSTLPIIPIDTLLTEGSKISGRFDTGDTIDTIALNKMLQQDPTITQIAANWNESPLINYEIKTKED